MKLVDAILNRWSPREFDSRPVDKKQLAEIFETVRWAQSSYNEQPWRFLLALKQNEKLREQMESYLHEGNHFAREAPVLGMAFAKKRFSRDGRLNPHALHDVGAACQILALKAFQMGLNSRFMAGFDSSKSRELCPEDFEPVVMFVIGRATAAAKKNGPQNRARKKWDEFLYVNGWGKSL